MSHKTIIPFPSPRPEARKRRRPIMLIRAAKAGQTGWRRHIHLANLLGCDTCPEPHIAAYLLCQEEQELNNLRLSKDASYSAQRHVLVMIALMAEMKVLSDSKS